MAKKCQGCGQPSEWTMQPYGPDDHITFTTPGSHYRGFPAVAVCDECKIRVQAGGRVTFRMRGQMVTVWENANAYDGEVPPKGTSNEQ